MHGRRHPVRHTAATDRRLTRATYAATLRSNQTWLLYVNDHPLVHQLLGRRGCDQWQIVQWYTAVLPEIGTALTLPDGIDTLVGAGGTTHLVEEILLTSHPPPSLLTLSRETYRRNGSHTCTILDIRVRTSAGYTGHQPQTSNRLRPAY